jgi:uncharacterized protein YpmB
MKKWIFLFVILTIAIIGFGINVYVNAMEPLKIAEKKALSLAKKETDIQEVEDFHLYHGQETVNVIEGKNKRSERIIIWIPEKSKKVFVRKAKNGLTKGDAIQKLLQEKNSVEIISVRLGMEKNIPLWEIHYRSNNNLINYYYIHFETGEWLKEIENL